MKFLTLVCLIPHILAYGGKLRKALPKTAPLKHDYEAQIFDSIDDITAEYQWDDKVSMNVDFKDGSDEMDFQTPKLKITVPMYEDNSRKFKIGAFPMRTIEYQIGTRVLTDDVAIYIIYYGGWSQQQKDILNEFTASLGDSCAFI